MGTGVLLCGLNGSGKSTLGRLLAGKLGARYLDAEELYFPDNGLHTDYRNPCSRRQVEDRLTREASAPGCFVFTAVRADYGEAFTACLSCALVLEVPRAVRLKRVRERSEQQFGERILPGGDRYLEETRFWNAVAMRSESYVEDWVSTLTCPVLRVDGTLPPEENGERLLPLLMHLLSMPSPEQQNLYGMGRINYV